MGTFVSWLSPDVTTRRVPIHLQFSPHPAPIHLQFCSPSTPHYAYFRTTCYSPSKKPSSRPIFKLRAAPAVAEIFPFCCRFTSSFLSCITILLSLWTSYQNKVTIFLKKHFLKRTVHQNILVNHNFRVPVLFLRINVVKADCVSMHILSVKVRRANCMFPHNKVQQEINISNFFERLNLTCAVLFHRSWTAPDWGIKPSLDSENHKFKVPTSDIWPSTAHTGLRQIVGLKRCCEF